jgi:hypothetical protein
MWGDGAPTMPYLEQDGLEITATCYVAPFYLMKNNDDCKWIEIPTLGDSDISKRRFWGPDLTQLLCWGPPWGAPGWVERGWSLDGELS